MAGRGEGAARRAFRTFQPLDERLRGLEGDLSLTAAVTPADEALVRVLEWLRFDERLAASQRRAAAAVTRWFLGAIQGRRGSAKVGACVRFREAHCPDVARGRGSAGGRI